jgi:pyrimidine operon attenuation protein / uracil phosphoribosyltransferase
VNTPRVRTVLEAEDIDRVLTRIAHEIVERARGAQDLVLLGIQTRGVPLAYRIGQKISDFENVEVPVGELDITMYRDDLRLRPARALETTALPDVGIDGRIVVLIDDVLFSGQTIRAALDAFQELGRPRVVRLGVLVDRGHRQLPIRADYVGKNLPTSMQESVRVRLREIDGVDSVTLSAGTESTGPDRPGGDAA